MSKRLIRSVALLSLLALVQAAAGAEPPLRQRLKALQFKIAWECYVNDNWEIFVMNADGSDPVNLSQTPQVHEHTLAFVPKLVAVTLVLIAMGPLLGAQVLRFTQALLLAIPTVH